MDSFKDVKENIKPMGKLEAGDNLNILHIDCSDKKCNKSNKNYAGENFADAVERSWNPNIGSNVSNHQHHCAKIKVHEHTNCKTNLKIRRLDSLVCDKTLKILPCECKANTHINGDNSYTNHNVGKKNHNESKKKFMYNNRVKSQDKEMIICNNISSGDINSTKIAVHCNKSMQEDATGSNKSCSLKNSKIINANSKSKTNAHDLDDFDHNAFIKKFEFPPIDQTITNKCWTSKFDAKTNSSFDPLNYKSKKIKKLFSSLADKNRSNRSKKSSDLNKISAKNNWDSNLNIANVNNIYNDNIPFEQVNLPTSTVIKDLNSKKSNKLNMLGDLNPAIKMKKNSDKNKKFKNRDNPYYTLKVDNAIGDFISPPNNTDRWWIRDSSSDSSDNLFCDYNKKSSHKLRPHLKDDRDKLVHCFPIKPLNSDLSSIKDENTDSLISFSDNIEKNSIATLKKLDGLFNDIKPIDKDIAKQSNNHSNLDESRSFNLMSEYKNYIWAGSSVDVDDYLDPSFSDDHDESDECKKLKSFKTFFDDLKTKRREEICRRVHTQETVDRKGIQIMDGKKSHTSKPNGLELHGNVKLPSNTTLCVNINNSDNFKSEKRKKYRLRLCVDPLLCVHG